MAFTTRILLQGKYDSLNKLLGAANHNRFAGAGIKKRNQQQMKVQLLDCPKIPKHCSYYFVWHRSDKREDPDNIASAVKYFFDALQEVGLIENDNWEYISEIHHEFKTDTPKGMEFVEVDIEEVLY